MNLQAPSFSTNVPSTPSLYQSPAGSSWQNKKGEMLAASSLTNIEWPSDDPELCQQSTRIVESSDRQSLKEAALNVSLDIVRFIESHRGLDQSQLLYSFLMSEAIQFNPKGAIDKALMCQSKINAAVSRGKELTLVYALFSKIPNRAKQMTGAASATAGEEATFLHLQHIADMSRMIYQPGIRFIVLVDAAFYNPAIGHNEVAIRHYIDDLHRLKSELGTSNIELIDYSELLAAECGREFDAALRHASLSLPTDSEMLAVNGGWLESMRSIVNTLDYPLSYLDQRELFSRQRNPGNRWYALVGLQAKEGLRRMIALKAAAQEVGLPARMWPGHLRVSCHWKRVDGTEPLPGIRVYPRYYASSRILPYHGVPLIRRSTRGLQLDILPEIALRGRQELNRVVHQNGDTYLYEAR